MLQILFYEYFLEKKYHISTTVTVVRAFQRMDVAVTKAFTVHMFYHTVRIKAKLCVL
jgi:transcription initiation factor IIF auxiliary subunit